jgi:hypothetical protein
LQDKQTSVPEVVLQIAQPGPQIEQLLTPPAEVYPAGHIVHVPFEKYP